MLQSKSSIFPTLLTYTTPFQPLTPTTPPTQTLITITMAGFTLMFTPTAAVYGRSGYNKDGDEEENNKGRSGYNKDGNDDDDDKNKGRSGYNKDGDDEEDK
ncbi:hypothetical protein CGCS363_v005199 [Colletotrichum siamense]|uniref:uncharacterized protein n=1 Tax=Colletotrichum siamense TaxID=690259 RepID=UPI0018730386|nr:uncharacterized protein CGCS363_v005199 [Colletotrichum siamense]KAF5505988.1 hypothetical protein CGCS363_v005199 [Colletotrichum siamense]